MGPGLQADTNASLTPRAVETRERILDAAESVFAQRGFDAATTREIAALSETNVATDLQLFRKQGGALCGRPPTRNRAADRADGSVRR